MVLKSVKKSNIDFESDVTAHKPKQSDLATITALAEELRGIESYLEKLEDVAKKKLERANIITLQLLPDAMLTVGMKDFTLSTGEKIDIKDIVRGSIPSNGAIEKADGPERAVLVGRREDAFRWLREQKADSLIATELVAAFGKGQAKEAKSFQVAIVKAGFPAQIEETVNHQTLNKYLREQIAAGTKVPETTFSLFTGKQAVITKPKVKKP